MKKSSGGIKIFCTIDPTELTKVGNEYYCNKCSHTLINVAEESKKQRNQIQVSSLICGFVSALSLTSCSTHVDNETIKNSELPLSANNNAIINKIEKPTKERDIPLPGIYFSSEDMKAKDQEYPIAKPVVGKVGFVESPFGGHHIDVSHLPEGSLAMDPNYPMKDRKIFRIKMSNKSQ